MIEYVIKRNGNIEKFNHEKLDKWCKYATSVGGNWADISLSAMKRLPSTCRSDDIHETLIQVCVEKENIVYSRVASRLEYAKIRKNMKRILGVTDKDDFVKIYNALIDLGIWNDEVIPDFNPRWNYWYEDLRKTYFEYWQVKQWVDKYAMKYNGEVIETPHIGLLGIALGIFGDTTEAYEFAKALILGKINLPTPVYNGIRNGDFDTISCCVISAGDTIDSIGVGAHIAYKMTAKKAGIGIEFTTRTKGDDVRGGLVKHLGKHPIYEMVKSSVRCMTQITRGGNATITVKCIDPEVENIIYWKSQRTDIEQRLDKLDFSFAYNDAFVQAVKNDDYWYLFSYADAPELYYQFGSLSPEYYNTIVADLLNKGVKHKKIKALDLLKTYLKIRIETGRFYDINLSRANEHTPFIDPIVQSNLCMEICLPTKPYEGMKDLYSDESKGETAFCSLAAINVAKTKSNEYDRIAYLALRAVDELIDLAPAFTESMNKSRKKRRSVGIGILGLADYIYNVGYDYDSDGVLSLVKEVAEQHYYSLLKASQKIAKMFPHKIVSNINVNWLPIDTMRNVDKNELNHDWEVLRGLPRAHSVLVAHMPTESSSVLSSATNGLYPIRNKIVSKRSRKGIVQFICQSHKWQKTAWEIDNTTLSKIYGIVQDFTDQAISADYYYDLNRYGGKILMSDLIKEWILHNELGIKTKYYANTKMVEKKTAHKELEMSVEDDGCESCKL